MTEKIELPISVVIPTLNRAKVLVGTINSLLFGVSIPNEIIVVDQSDKILDVAIHTEWENHVKVIKEDILSSARARNIGVKNSKNDIILFCDDDIEIDERTIENLYKQIMKQDVSLIAAVNCKENAIYDYHEKDHRRLRNIAGYLCGTRIPGKSGGYIIRWSMKGHYMEGMTKPHATEWAYGFFFCIKKSLMEKWDIWFDENLIRYAFAEDMDFSYRYCRKSEGEHLRTLVDPRLYVHHLISNEWRIPSEEAITFGFVNRWYLSYKLFPSQWWYRIGMVWLDVMYTLLVYRNGEKIMGFKAMWHTYRERKYLKKGLIRR